MSITIDQDQLIKQIITQVTPIEVQKLVKSAVKTELSVEVKKLVRLQLNKMKKSTKFVELMRKEVLELILNKIKNNLEITFNLY